MKRDVTIVIPCYNEEGYIGRTLKEIDQQIGTTGIRVIIADGGSTDSTIQEIEKVSGEVTLNIEVVPGGSVTVGRNFGASLAKTKYILFLDSDVTFTSKTCIFDSFRTMKYKDLDLVSTTPIYSGEKDILAKILFSLNKHTTRFLARRSPFAIGAFTLVKKEAFDEIGGYDEDAKHTEDWLFSMKIRPQKFGLITGLITQDNRRFKKYGYFRMVKLMVMNYLNRKNPEYFYKDVNYWS